MAAFIPINFPTKKYIAAYLQRHLGPKPHITSTHWVGQLFISLLQHTANERIGDYPAKHYDHTIKIYISPYIFNQRGQFIHETNIKYFNRFMELYIKDNIRNGIESHLKTCGVLYLSVDRAREEMGIPESEMNDDVIIKDFYRWRRECNKPMLKTGPKYIETSFDTVVKNKLLEADMYRMMEKSLQNLENKGFNP